MKLWIAICDDDMVQVGIVKNLIESEKLKYDVQIIEAYSGLELLKQVETQRVDIVFLDIEMDGLNGIETGKKIRQMYHDTIIVYLTGYKNYALEAFQIHSFDYLLKPITEERFHKLIEDIIIRFDQIKIMREKNNIFTIKTKDKIVKLKYDDIVYFVKIRKKVKIYSSKGNYEFYYSIKDLLKELEGSQFLQCHQGYIINRDKILEVRNDEIYFYDIEDTVPVSRRYRKDVMEALAGNLFS